MYARNLGWVLICLTSVAAGTALRTAAQTSANEKQHPKEVDLSGVTKYRDWTLTNKNPYYVKPLPASLCASAITVQPHAGWYIRVFVNSAGKKAFLQKGNSAFPEGAIIVKEKLLSRSSTDPTLLTVMVKREKGFNPKQGDWEYALFMGKDLKLQERGKLASCQGCHAQQHKSDYVFRTYLTENDRKAYSKMAAGVQSVARR